MQQSFAILRRTELEKTYADLCQKYQAACADLRSETHSARRVAIQNEIAQFAAEITATENELGSLEFSRPTVQHRELRMKKALQRINFTEALTCVRETVESFGRVGGAAMFLLENSRPMAGDCCIGRIRELLEADTHPDHFREYPVEFSVGMQLDEYGLFQHLGKHVGLLSTFPHLAGYAQAIIEKICASVQGGSVLFLVLHKWDLLEGRQAHVLRQFLDLFWLPLVGRFPLPEKRQIKLIAVVASDSPLNQSCRALSFCCPQTAFPVKHLLPLALRHWTLDEIQDWLERFSGWDASMIDQFARHLYHANCDGLPQLVYQQLLQEFASTQEV